MPSLLIYDDHQTFVCHYLNFVQRTNVGAAMVVHYFLRGSTHTSPQEVDLESLKRISY